MSKPPIKAIQSIKNYCEKTQCRLCVFGFRYSDDYDYVGCRLTEGSPCDWEVPEEDKKA